MSRSQEIVIKTSPVVFLSWLIAIELVGGLFGFVLALLIDLPDVYTDLQLTRYASFNFMLGLVLTLVQVSVISVAFFVWFFNTYRADREKITQQRVTFFGTRDLVRTQAIAGIKVKQSWLGRSFNYGTLELLPLDKKAVLKLRHIPNPAHYAAEIRNLIRPRHVEIDQEAEKSIPALIASGESQTLEFKSSFSWDYRRQSINRGLNKAVMKNIVGFMNTTGGIILLGIDDDGRILGLEQEFQSLPKPNVDGFENSFNTVFANMIGAEYRHYMSLEFEVLDNRTVGRILAFPAPEPVYLVNKNNEEFYIRTGNSSQPLSIRKAVKYIETHFLR
jgi:hypothetical protein